MDTAPEDGAVATEAQPEDAARANATGGPQHLSPQTSPARSSSQSSAGRDSPGFSLVATDRTTSVTLTQVHEAHHSFAHLEKNQRSVDQSVQMDDLTATEADRQIHGPGVKWYNCLVNSAETTETTESCGRAPIARASDTQGEGGHGKVHRAVWKGSIDVAIKVHNSAENMEEIKLFVDLRHPNIVACYGILHWRSGQKRIVMERCATTLRSFLHSNDHWQNSSGEQLNPDAIDERKYHILEDVSQGLRTLHDLSVLHRDLKTTNIVLKSESSSCEHCRPSGTWKICDVSTGTRSVPSPRRAS